MRFEMFQAQRVKRAHAGILSDNEHISRFQIPPIQTWDFQFHIRFTNDTDKGHCLIMSTTVLSNNVY